VDSALTEYYVGSVRDAAAAERVGERAIREWFSRHLLVEQGGQRIRSQVLQGPQQSGGLDNRVIARLEDVHLVRAERRGGRTWFELAHDRLRDPVWNNNAVWFEGNLSLLERR